MENLKVVLFGLGPIGIKTLQLLETKQNYQLTAVVDINPELQGKNVNHLCETKSFDLKVQNQAPQEDFDLAIFTTTSNFLSLIKQVTPIIERGISVVTTCEEAAYPYRRYPEEAKNFNQKLIDHKASLIGTGINPGFLMDTLPVVLSAITQKVDHVKVTRIQDALNRRMPFQMKIGSGLTVQDFKDKVSKLEIRHVGLEESAWVIIDGLGLQVEKLEETIEPVTCDKDETLGTWELKKGMVRGVQQIAKGYDRQGNIIIELLFRASLNEGKDLDQIEFKGKPNLTIQAPDGVNGDGGTVSMVINSLRAAFETRPGLITPLELVPQRNR